MVTLEQANSIIEHSLAKAAEMQIAPPAVVVLDTGGNVVAGQR